MPCLIAVLRDDGLLPIDHTAQSLQEAVAFEPPNGVYTVANTFHITQVLKFDAHLDRLEDSARRAGIPLTLNRPKLRGALRQMIVDSGYGDVRYRITVAPDGADLMLSIEPFTVLSFESKSKGLPFITVPNSARDHARTKSTNWMLERQQIAKSLPQGVMDAILLDADGYMLETMTANFYGIIDGTLYTAEKGILHGISRQIALEVADGVLPVVLQPPHIDQLPMMSEAFFSSSSRGIVPINRIDERTFSDFLITHDLMKRYDVWVTAHLQEL